MNSGGCSGYSYEFRLENGPPPGSMVTSAPEVTWNCSRRTSSSSRHAAISVQVVGENWLKKLGKVRVTRMFEGFCKPQ